MRCHFIPCICRAYSYWTEDVPGSFQQYVAGVANYLNVIPENLSDEHAAPLLCAGVTVYDALKVSCRASTTRKCSDGLLQKAHAGENDWVIIFGGGGGLGHL